MNRAQAGRLETTLYLLNQSVFELDRALDQDEVDEPLFHWKSALSAEKKAVMRSRLAELRAIIARIARDHGIEKREENRLGRVAGQLHSHWVTIEDSKTKGLSTYGEIPAGLKEKLDPELERLNAGVRLLLDELTVKR